MYTLHHLKIDVNNVDMRPISSRSSYHHGDLRRTLIAFGLRRVRAGGVDDFSLREAARAAGVTAGAVYKHFDSKDQLLRAVAAEGFRLFAGRMLRETGDLRGAARLRAVGRSYVSFASREPRLFRLMFSWIGKQCETAVSSGKNFQINSSSYEQLRQALAEAVGVTPAQVDSPLLSLAWSVAHGAGSLICDGVWERNDERAADAIDAFVRMAIAKGR